jgi:hypothetical protein
MGYKKIMNLPDFPNTGYRAKKQEMQAGSEGKFLPVFWLFYLFQPAGRLQGLSVESFLTASIPVWLSQSSYRISGHHALYEDPHRYCSGKIP